MDLLLIVGMIQCTLSIFFIVMLKRPLGVANKILLATFAVILTILFTDFIGDRQSIRYLSELNTTLSFTLPIFFYLYLRFSISSDRAFMIQDLIYFTPIPILFILFSMSDYYQTHIVMEVYSREYLIIDILIGAFIIGFGFLTYYKHWKHLLQLKNIYSYESNRLKLYWVTVLLTIYIVFMLVAGYISNVQDSNFIYRPLFNLFWVITSYCLAIMAIWQKPIMATGDDTRYKHSSLKEELTKDLIDRVIAYMEQEKPFLENDFNLNELSRQTEIPKHHLTELLNKYLKTNFFLFVRKYRVEHVISLLHQPGNKNVKFLHLAFDSGFNSKTSFNRAFKETTGKTPSQYLDQVTKTRNPVVSSD